MSLLSNKDKKKLPELIALKEKAEQQSNNMSEKEIDFGSLKIKKESWSCYEVSYKRCV